MRNVMLHTQALGLVRAMLEFDREHYEVTFEAIATESHESLLDAVGFLALQLAAQLSIEVESVTAVERIDELTLAEWERGDDDPATRASRPQ